MAKFEVIDTFTPMLEKLPGVMKAAAVRGTRQTVPKVLARMQANAPRLTGEMASKLTADGGVAGIFDSEQASVALYNEYSPNHQPFMRPAAQASIGDLEAAVSAQMSDAESELAE